MGNETPSRDLLVVTTTFLLVLACVGGAWKFITARQPASAGESAAIAEQSELMTLQLQDQLAEEIASQPLHEQQERIDSPMGQALLRKCIEWTEFHDNHPNESTRSNRDVACTEYSGFVESGSIPE